MLHKKKKCPICGAKMSHENDDAICPECGYRASYSTSGFHTNASPVAGSNHTRKQVNKQVYSHLAYVFVFFIAAILLGTVSYHIITYISAKREPATQTYNTDDMAYLDSDENQNNNAKLEESHTPKIRTSKVRLPESELFQQFIARLFDKDYQNVTSDELAQVAALHVYEVNGYIVIAYTLQDSSAGELYFNQNRINTSDFACFPQLCSINVRDSFGMGDLDSLTKLTKLWCRNSPEELAKLIDPLQLTDLGIDNDLFLHGLKDIEMFSNVTHLRLKSIRSDNLSPLISMEKLTALEIIDGGNVEDFSALYQMTGLEALTIDSNKLRDIGFIANMPHLKELSIQNSIVMKLDVLAERADTLQKLDLSENYKFVDRNYEAISTLTHLTDLTLTASYDHEDPPFLPKLSNMPELTRLSIKGYDNLTPIADAPQLEEITMTRCYANDYSVLEMLPNMTSLNLFDISIMQPALDSIGKLTQLERLNLEGSYIWGNCESFLNLPNLREFDIDNCTTGFDVNNLKTNENLEILHISHVTTKALVNGEWDYHANNENNFYLADYTDIFQNYPNLQELYFAENTLSNLSFAEGLKHLRILDITDNYVTDLTPLSELLELESVLCARNAVVNNGGLGENALIKN